MRKIGGIQLAKTITMQQKIKVLTKVVESGCDTEKKLLKLEMEDILKIKGITIPDMNIIIELQKNTKAGKLYSYLSDGTDEAIKRGESDDV